MPTNWQLIALSYRRQPICISVDDKLWRMSAASNEVRAVDHSESQKLNRKNFSIIENLSFKEARKLYSVEGRVVRDADRLDALECDRYFTDELFGGSHQHPIHVSDLAPKTFQNHEDFRKGRR